MVEHVSKGHLAVECGVAFQRQQPRLLDDAEEEETAVALDGADEPLELSSSGPVAFGAGSNGCGGVDGDGRVVRVEGNEHGVEWRPMACDVGGFGVDEAGEAAGAARHVDGLEEVRDGLAEGFHVVVRWLAGDCGECGREIAEEGFGFLRRRHGADRWVEADFRLIVALVLSTCVKEHHGDGKNHVLIL